jgi:predicted AAA+ superfamily ATPase
MQRQLLSDQLIAWKNKAYRKPLLIDGARQTGKTYLLKRLFSQAFTHTLYLDFLERPELADAFAGTLTPANILTNLELLTGQTFNPTTDLLILDEIGECPRALTALKYFAEQAPTYFVAATGSNIGLLQAFPVGKVEQHYLRPLTFREFLWVSAKPALIKAYEARVNTVVAHAKLFDLLTDYYFTGGLPEAVATWVTLAKSPILERVAAVTQIHANLIAGYQRDFGKYAGKVDAQLIEAVFNAIPAQLSMVQDESVNRFKFKGIAPRKSRYGDFSSAINWLHRSRLVLKNYPINGRPQTPLAAYQKENCVKLFLFDVGLLNHQLGTGYPAIKKQGEAYKGYIAENFVQQEFAAMGIQPSFSWQDARAEIEFILDNGAGQVIPVEVKSGSRTRAKSLHSYKTKCSPEQTIKLTGTLGSPSNEQTNLVLPLYYVEHILER